MSAQFSVLDGMTLEQRIGQLFMVNLFGSQLTEVGGEFLEVYQPGGLVLIGENIGDAAEVTRLVNSYQETITAADGLPLLIAVDQEGGPISHLRDGFTTFPTPTLMTAAADPDLAYRVGQAMAMELRAVGVNMNLAPIADLETNANNPIIVRRSFGSDPLEVSPMLAAYIQGLQSANVLGTAKHFPGHGASDTDSHTSLPVINLDRERLDAVELAPFRAAIEAEVAAIMVAHIWYPELDPVANRPASLSPVVMTELLRRELGYQGLIVTDALDMDAIDTIYSYPQAVVAAVQAGADMVVSAHVSLDSQIAAIEALRMAVLSGEIAESRINESVARILDAKTHFGVMNWQPLDSAMLSERMDQGLHEALVAELFLEGVTVAHDPQGLIPLAVDRSVGIIFPGSRNQITRECQPYRSDARWLAVSLSPQPGEILAAQDLANQVDTVVVFTQNADTDPAQQSLISALPLEKTIVVAIWSPYDWLTIPTPAAYMTTYSPLELAVSAACAILFGAVPGSRQFALSLPGIP
jgi:beta-N-acetylhexosaminidase